MSEQPSQALTETLAQYPFTRPVARLLRHNENLTYAVEDGPRRYLLRVHREAKGLDFSMFRGGFDRATLVESELELLRRLQEAGGLRLQRPVANAAGRYATRLTNGETASVLTWLKGETLASGIPDARQAERLGRLLARLHRAAEGLAPLRRCRYDGAFVDRVQAGLDAAFQDGHFAAAPYRQMKALCALLGTLLDREQSRFQLVHGDLSRSNLLDGAEGLAAIDFSMAGYSLPELDVGDLLCACGDRWAAPLLAGYAAEGGRPLEREAIELFYAFSVVGYVAIHHGALWTQDSFGRNLERWSGTIFAPLLARRS